MKNNKIFILVEAVLAILAIILASVMLNGNTNSVVGKVAVIIPDSDGNQWASLRYGLKKASKDFNTEMFVVDTGKTMTVKEQQHLIDQEIKQGADAIILQPATGANMEAMLTKSDHQIPILLIGSKASLTSKTTALNTVEPDNYAMGKALAKEILNDYSGNLAGKTIGLVSETKSTEAVARRQQGFENGIKGKGAMISWQTSRSTETDQTKKRSQLTRTNVLVALDDQSLTILGNQVKTNNLTGPVVYGIGHSTEAIYYLDTDAVECLIVPDQFSMGYQSLSQLAQFLKHPYKGIQDQSVSFRVIRREQLFSEKNQQLLTTMNQ